MGLLLGGLRYRHVPPVLHSCRSVNILGFFAPSTKKDFLTCDEGAAV
jgi:hypothetical protein